MRLPVALAALALLLSGSEALAQEGPLRHRLAFAPTAYAIEARQVSVGLSSGLVPSVAVGLGRGLSADVRAFPFARGLGAGEIKVTLAEGPRGAFAAGATVSARGDGWDGGAGPFDAMAYGVATLGGDAARLNLVAGARGTMVPDPVSGDPYQDAHSSPPVSETFRVLPQPVLMAGTDVRVTRRVRWMTEAVLSPDVTYSAPAASPRSGEAEMGSVSSAYRTLFAGTALRISAGRAAFDVGVIGAAGTLASRIRDGSRVALVPYPWLSVGVGL